MEWAYHRAIQGTSDEKNIERRRRSRRSRSEVLQLLDARPNLIRFPGYKQK